MSYITAFEIGRLYQPIKSIADAISLATPFQQELLPFTRSYLPMSLIGGLGAGYVINAAAQVYGGVMSGGAYASLDGDVPMVTFDGVNGTVTMSSGPANRITGTETDVDPAYNGLTLGGWARYTTSGNTEGFVSKYGLDGFKSYYLLKSTADVAEFILSSNGTAISYVDHTTVMQLNTWYHIVGRFTPSTEIAIFVNGIKVSGGTPPASIYDSTASGKIGSSDKPTANYMAGDVSRISICAGALPDDIILDWYARTKSLYTP